MEAVMQFADAINSSALQMLEAAIGGFVVAGVAIGLTVGGFLVVGLLNAISRVPPRRLR
jgi:hypothetical protein